MFDETVYLDLAENQKALLHHIVRRHLRSGTPSNQVEDVVQEGLCAVWNARERIDDTSAYLKRTLYTYAINWHQKGRKYKDGVPVSLDFYESNEIGEDGARHGMREYSRRELHQMIQAKWAEKKRSNQGKAFEMLSKKARRDLEEWKSRGFRCVNHGQACAVSRARKELRTHLSKLEN